MSSIIIVRVSAADKLAHRRFNRVYEKWRWVRARQQAGSESAAEATSDRAAALNAEFAALSERSTQVQDPRPTLTRLNMVVDKIKAETAFLERELAQSRDQAIEKSRLDHRDQQYRQLAASVLKRSGPALAEEAAARLKGLAEGSGSPESAEAILRQALDSTVQADLPNAGPSGSQLILSQLLAAPLPAVEPWLARNSDPKWRRLESYIAELELFFPQAAEAFAARLAELEKNGGGNSLLLDSLVLDLGRALEKQRRAAADMETLRDLVDDIQTLSREENPGLAAENFISRAAAAEGGRDPVQPLIEEGRKILGELERRRTAEVTRREVLSGLAELGYEVSESAAAIWRENGRLVLKDSAAPQYGVEIGGDAGRRLQFRPVGLTAEADGRRDYEIETSWCDKFKQLQQRLADEGTELTVEKTLDPGASPIKRLAGASLNQGRNQSPDLARSRQA